METMPFQVEPTALVRNLSAGEKQKVEILKQLYLRRKVLILDEPTSVLTPDEADEMLAMVRGLCNEGRLSVLMITHKFREVMGFCDEVTVLRHGKLTGEGVVRDLDPKTMAEMMMGTATLPEQAARDDAPPAMRPRAAPGDRGPDGRRTKSACRCCAVCRWRCSAHEIVGIAGVSGNGQRQLVQVLAGQRAPSGGRIRVHGEDYRATPRRDSPPPLPRPAGDAAAERLRRHHDHRPKTWPSAPSTGRR